MAVARHSEILEWGAGGASQEHYQGEARLNHGGGVGEVLTG